MTEATTPPGPAEPAAPHGRAGRNLAVRHGEWKLLKVRGDKQPRLYNLDKDIGEKEDLANAEPERVKELQVIWNRWNETLEEPAWKPGPPGPNAKAKAKKKAKIPSN